MVLLAGSEPRTTTIPSFILLPFLTLKVDLNQPDVYLPKHKHYGTKLCKFVEVVELRLRTN